MAGVRRDVRRARISLSGLVITQASPGQGKKAWRRPKKSERALQLARHRDAARFHQKSPIPRGGQGQAPETALMRLLRFVCMSESGKQQVLLSVCCVAWDAPVRGFSLDSA
ncbi:hypothetical protein EJ06DRAFT_370827 [Trichodelitschia bisporula]|uniref:Uncharacterized protein n=1 Tax=Trichodelitschia bisporula TaxID=703511 RepID=A0A6G1I151_9PEZI|nr:hypothetical protein EJ06DRAFT_370827 [Trichodelitschia bisporula]